MIALSLLALTLALSPAGEGTKEMIALSLLALTLVLGHILILG
jgi:hypothetical protein